MRFSDLIGLEKVYQFAKERSFAIQNMLPHVPIDVVNQFYSDHCSNSAYQRYYGHLKLDDIHWTLLEFTGDEIVSFTHIAEYDRRYIDSRDRGFKAGSMGLEYAHSCKKVIDYWRNHNTWIVAPITIEGSLVSLTSKYHLVEGHTRLGLLNGFIDVGLIDKSVIHKVWVGSCAVIN